jgi:type IX secretion system PorP/SprF family membrane protein
VIYTETIPFKDAIRCKFLTSFVILFFAFHGLSAQDPIFTQFYSNPIYLNPALTGTGECSRIMLNYRNQWPSIENSFTTYAFSADHYVDALSGGIGVLVYSDNAMEVVNTLKVSGTYAYKLQIGRDMQLNAGFEVSYYQQKINWGNLVFADMIDRVSGTINQSSSVEIAPDNLTRQVADFSIGFLYGIQEKYFIGVSANHLTQPDLSYYSPGSEGFLYRKYTAHAGGTFKLSDGDFRYGRWAMSLMPSVVYQQQQNARQLSFGFNFIMMPLTVGWYYRHNILNSDAVSLIAGIHHKTIKFGYSYDYSLSKLKSISGGAHEISITLLVNCSKKRKRPGAIKCPEF